MGSLRSLRNKEKDNSTHASRVWNSQIMRKYMREIRPDTIEDLTDYCLYDTIATMSSLQALKDLERLLGIEE